MEKLERVVADTTETTAKVPAVSTETNTAKEDTILLAKLYENRPVVKIGDIEAKTKVKELKLQFNQNANNDIHTFAEKNGNFQTRFYASKDSKAFYNEMLSFIYNKEVQLSNKQLSECLASSYVQKLANNGERYTKTIQNKFSISQFLKTAQNYVYAIKAINKADFDTATKDKLEEIRRKKANKKGGKK